MEELSHHDMNVRLKYRKQMFGFCIDNKQLFDYNNKYREKRNQKIEMERLVDVLPKMRESDTGG